MIAEDLNILSKRNTAQNRIGRDFIDDTSCYSVALRCLEFWLRRGTKGYEGRARVVDAFSECLSRGGYQSGSGNDFANLEVMALVEMLVGRFGMIPDEGRWHNPQQDPSNASLAIAPPRSKVYVEVFERQRQRQRKRILGVTNGDLTDERQAQLASWYSDSIAKI